MELVTIKALKHIIARELCGECQKENCDDCKIGKIREQIVELEKEYEQ